MEAVLIIDRIKVTNANAIAGLTYGFPSPTSFLGFVHALERRLLLPPGSFSGVAIVTHDHELCAYKNVFGQRTFALTRNPLSKEEKTAALVEEGRMHLEVSLVIATSLGRYEVGDLLGLTDATPDRANTEFAQRVSGLLPLLRLAGGRINGWRGVYLQAVAEDQEAREKQLHKVLRKLVPGFCLVDRSDKLREHHAKTKEQEADREFIDSWLDFYTLTYRADKPKERADDGDVEWRLEPRPATGWLVPLLVGYRGISPLYEPGMVSHVRDEAVPCRFVEGVYGIGEWLSPHRVMRLEDILWRYETGDEWYLCVQSVPS